MKEFAGSRFLLLAGASVTTAGWALPLATVADGLGWTGCVQGSSAPNNCSGGSDGRPEQAYNWSNVLSRGCTHLICQWP